MKEVELKQAEGVKNKQARILEKEELEQQVSRPRK